jgi:cobyrinic acid a,c-diamide synthase
MGTVPRLVIAGTASGVGKTSLVLGLTHELARRGLRVQTFKVGPDFLDPTWLALASGRPCYNLDGWMTSQRYVVELFARAAGDADIALIEGVMGLFDGASPVGLEGSTAEVAAWLDAPVLLVVPARGAGRSLAATVLGFARFEPAVGIAGVIANQGGSARHRAWLAEGLDSAGLPPLVGAVPRGALPPLPSRHLGLVTAAPGNLTPAILARLADACRAHLDVEAILRKAEGGGGKGEGGAAGGQWSVVSCQLPVATDHGPRTTDLASFRLGVAWDEAFHFYYADNLEALEARGVEICRFSPLADAGLPADVAGVYLGGGYPELYAERLAANEAMLCEIRAWAAAGRPLYAECGGLMYLGRSLVTREGTRHAMAGVLPVETVVLDRLKTLGYVEVSLAADSLWGPAGAVCRGHEFHYSEIAATSPLPPGEGQGVRGTCAAARTSDAPSRRASPGSVRSMVGRGGPEGWSAAYTVRRLRGEPVAEGFVRGNVLASYVHLHWASRPEVADRLVAAMAARAQAGDRRRVHEEAKL